MNRPPEMTGFALGVLTMAALARSGIRPGGWFWRWRPGAQGGVFPDHYERNGLYASQIDDFETLPQEDLNADYCMCQLQPVFRDDRGRFARNPLRAP